MEINTTVLQFHKLVEQFNSHKDFSSEGNKIFKEKEKKLVEFSKNVNSLPVCLLVLENSNQISPLYFASQFVKDKLKYQFQQLTTDVIENTHSRIVALIQSNRNWSKIIRNNFALCLTYLYIHCYDKLGSVLIFYCKTFQIADLLTANLGKIQCQYLFRYLDGLACEVDNKRLVIDQIKRNQVQNALKNQQKEIIMLLHHIYTRISGSNTQLAIEDVQKLLFSFSQWIRMGVMPPQITQQLHNHSLFQLALTNLSDTQLSEAAKQCILNAIQQIKSPDQSPQFYEFMGKNLFMLINTIMKQIKNQEYDQAQNFVKVLCEYGKHAGKAIIQNFNQHSLNFLQKMIMFTEDTMLQVFKDICDFWQEIIFFIESRQNKSQLTKEIADQIIVKLYTTFCEKIIYNNNQISQLNQLTQKQLVKLHQSVQDVRDKREDARFIFQSIGGYLKHQTFMNQVIKLIFALNKNQNDFWAKLQAYVFSIRDVAKKYVQPTPQICSLILYFQSLTDKPIILLKSILRLYESLLEMEQKNQEFILRILNNISLMFDKQILDQKTGKVFEKCCQKNANILVKHLGSIYQLLKMYPNKNSVLVGLTHILKKNPSILSQNLPVMLSGPLEKLKLTKSRKEQRQIFHKLFTIIQCIPKGESNDLIQIIQMLFQQMWPIIQQIISDPQDPKNGQDKLIQRAIRFIKLVMRSIPEQFIKYLPVIFEKILESYRKYPINSLVYIYEVAFTVYYQSTQTQLIDFLKQLYKEYCTITYPYLRQPQQIANFEHLCDDFIGLNKRIITFDTRMFYESGQVEAILKFSLHCLGSGVPRAASTASQLFQIIFMIYWSPYSRQQYQNKDKGEVVKYDQNNVKIYADLKNFILPNVDNLIRQMFNFLSLGFVQSARDNILDCLQAIALAFPKESAFIWNEPLSELGQDILTLTQKERLKENLLKIGSDVHTQFLNAQYTVGKILYTMASRFLYRKSRVKSLANNNL